MELCITDLAQLLSTFVKTNVFLLYTDPVYRGYTVSVGLQILKPAEAVHLHRFVN